MEKGQSSEMGGQTPTRERIFRTALALVAERGYEQVSMRDIARQVGIQAASIYNHFPGKAALMDEALARFRRALPAHEAPEPALTASSVPELRQRLIEIMVEPVALLDDPALEDIIRVVARAQYHHGPTRDFLLAELFRRPLARLEALLAPLAARQPGRGWSAAFLAAELHSPLASHFYLRSLHALPPAFDGAASRQALIHHVDFFLAALLPPGGES